MLSQTDTMMKCIVTLVLFYCLSASAQDYGGYGLEGGYGKEGIGKEEGLYGKEGLIGKEGYGGYGIKVFTI